MKRYDGILICSDWDGTFCIGSDIPKNNIEAIRYFQDNGGLFTVASGRFPSYLHPFFTEFSVNAPLICLNGSLIYDYQTQKSIKEGFIEDGAYDIVRKIFNSGLPYYDITAYFALANGGYTKTYCPSDFLCQMEELKTKKIYKLLCKTDTPQKACQGRSFAQSLGNTQYETVRSWDISLEIIRKEYNKAAASLFLKKRYCADLLVCVGDYENDISMLEAADISFAVQNATYDVKKAAKKLTIDAKDGAIADIISKL